MNELSKKVLAELAAKHDRLPQNAPRQPEDGETRS